MSAPVQRESPATCGHLPNALELSGGGGTAPEQHLDHSTAKRRYPPVRFSEWLGASAHPPLASFSAPRLPV